MKLTLDWNCVIEVEEQRPQAESVIDLVNAHRNGEFDVALLAASASENTKSKRFPGNACLFKERIAALGWDDLPIVLMPAVFGLSYFDFCFYVDESFEKEESELWSVIAPKVQLDPSCYLPEGQELNDDLIQSEALAKWRNSWCDVISAYSHIHAGRDVFVTNNTRDFQDKAPALAALGMKNISTPEGTRALIERLRKAP